ncbi:PREDICTED: uncharacterized protein LOC108609807 [Drosophila arizonae]|uniref:Uncharacterized protein LOC108609807 n=1 Tax=Drosophila arizonae TaxID=7263 RepID=A0ABM1NQ13_DROAR|nr:PREDICTED: uncharacterized protein LOC108609807 [Drosophila arizonae]
MKQLRRIGWGIKQHRRIYLVALLSCALVYYAISNRMPSSEDAQQSFDQPIEAGYFVNTSGCRMFALNPWPAALASYFHRLDNYACSKPAIFVAKTMREKNYLLRTLSDEKVLRLFQVNRVSDVVCTYKTVRRVDDLTNKYGKETTFRLGSRKIQVKVDDGSTTLRIWCVDRNNQTIYRDVHFFLPAANRQKARLKSSSANRLSVMIIGIDSISHMHYLRSMDQLSGYIKTLPHVEFWGYNSVGADWYANLMPLLSGLNAKELKTSRCYHSNSYDDCGLLWKHFKAAGYNTSYAEDMIGSSFSQDQFRFRQQPTDFYLRPVMREVHNHTGYVIDELDAISCTGSRKYSDILHEFFYKLTPHIERTPSFSFFWQSQGVHDYLNYAQLLDMNYLRLFHHLTENGILNRTLVLLMSDHGMLSSSYSTTYQGTLEESQPLLIAIYPKWLEEAYPLAISNLHSNDRSLVTSFDLHVTLKDLTNLELLRDTNIESQMIKLAALGRNMARGISLFLPIPETRTCPMAGIPPDYCLCHTSMPLAPDDERALIAGAFVVKQINLIIGNEAHCSQLILGVVKTAHVLSRDFDDYGFDVQVRLQTLPGKGLFEATTRFLGNSIDLNGPILRANKHGNESYCVDNKRIELFCFCTKSF